MAWLPLANIAHHKLRSALSSLGIAIGLCMVLTLTGLSRGSLQEVLNRWDSVRADLIVSPSSTNLTLASGPQIPLAAVQKLAAAGPAGRPLAQRITPVYLARMKIAGREHNVYGLRPGDFDVVRGQARLVAGRLPDEGGQAAAWLARQYERAAATDAVLSLEEQELAGAGALEMAIDTTLARLLGKSAGQTFEAANHTWRIVGVYQAGAVGRAVAPMATLQHLMGLGLEHVTLAFVELPAGADAGPAAESIRRLTRQAVLPKDQYQALLLENVGIMFTYIHTVNAVALAIALLFIMVTLYTMVLQRTREIAILKSMGASAAYLLRGVLAESMLLTAGGAAVGIGLAFAAAWLVERLRPDLTVAITPGWVGAGLGAAGVGAVLAALYPAWRAIRVDVAEALAFE